MYSLQLLLGIALGLCFVVPPMVQSQGCMPLGEDYQNYIVDLHNYIRSYVTPTASNMRRMYWSEELANLAAENACQCNFHYFGIPPIPYKNLYARESHSYHSYLDLEYMIHYWLLESSLYDYHNHECSTKGYCEHYINMVWARACEIGCALSVCPAGNILGGASGSQGNDNILGGVSDPQGNGGGGSLYMLSCVYGAGFPGDADLINYRPYFPGEPCDYCPAHFPVCDPYVLTYYSSPSRNLTIGTGGEVTIGNLCYNEEEACIGSDPHFAVRLHGGNLLCYTFQGVQNATFNLITNDKLVMNALFIPDRIAVNNTWLGSIGIAVLHEGKKMTTLEFTAADQLIRIGNKSLLDAKAIQELIFHNGQISVRKLPSNKIRIYPSVHIEFIDSGLDFTIKFAKNQHLDLYFHNNGMPSEDKGVVGQFFHDGVNIDVDAQLLHVPGRPPVPVQEQDLWKFTKQSLHSDSKCWTSAYRSNQGVGVVAGTYEDYMVEDLLSVGH